MVIIENMTARRAHKKAHAHAFPRALQTDREKRLCERIAFAAVAASQRTCALADGCDVPACTIGFVFERSPYARGIRDAFNEPTGT